MGNVYKLEDLEKGFIKELETRENIPLNIRYNNEYDILIPIDEHYHYLDLEEIKFMVQKLQNTLEKVSQKEIDEANKKMKNSLQKEYEESLKEIPKVRKKKKGYIYIISNNIGHYKIGYSKDVKRRIENLQSSTSFKLYLNCYIETTDMVKVEEFFHNKFKKRKIKGEWFKLTKDDIEYIKKASFPKEIMNEIIFDEVIADE